VGGKLDALDIGLPLDSLDPYLRAALNDGQSADPAGRMVLNAVNRHGGPTPLTMQLSHLRKTDDSVRGLILVMNILDHE
jgi:two-component system CheB/CheR fusion protein